MEWRVRSLLRRSLPCAILIASASAWLLVEASAGCGFDGVGSLELEGGAPPADAAVEPDARDAAVPDATTPGPCDDPAIILCVGFDGTAVDRAHAQPIQMNGTVKFIPGVVDRAVLLDSTSELTVADGPAWKYTALTFETWVRVDTLPPDGGRSGLLDKDLSFGVFVYPGGTLNCVMNNTASAVVLASAGQWVHIACVNDGSSTTLYANGVATKTVDAGPVSETTALAAIGNNSPNFGSPLIGALDLMRVYSRAKTAAEIAADAKR